MIPKKYTELNPRAHLREWKFSNGLLYGKVFFDQTKTFEDGFLVCFEAYTVVDYKDHYMVKIKGEIFKMEKRYEHKTVG